MIIWKLNDLDQYEDQEMHFKYELDLSDLIKSSDIKRIDKTIVKGNFNKLDRVYVFNFKIETTIYLECAISLKEVEFKISEWITEEYSKEDFSGYNIIDKDHICLEEMVYANILLLKPYRVVAPGVEFQEENHEYENSAFSGLKKYLGGKD